MKSTVVLALGLLGRGLATSMTGPAAAGRSIQQLSLLDRRLHQSNESRVIPRDDYTCGPGRPCRNGACCGESGYCGYGPTYCGDGCTSNCDAHAECGQYAEPANKKCPLNVCCSQHGFCGTTDEFCNEKCQSNCILHPKPPGGAQNGHTLSRVIGYWEAWNVRSKCHPTKAEDLPVDGLTHVNYAFAYIDPQSLQLTTMDAATPASTFQDLASLKLMSPNLQIFVSVGGWTFSDNDTVTQPVFGNIARSESNRQKFADNVLKFLNTLGYDGVDLDWEYPGAPDRGGKEDDTKNYVLLMKTLRETFDKSGRKLGLTYTAPSSFWYLRWFDLPGLNKYVDWVNVMSYDLHGVWDSNNPIGSIVQGHTNLTEIKLAAELFWRAGIRPSKMALGFGFYGRAFTLADPTCTKPGCPFSGGAKPGICTDTSGYLAHYEIQEILEKNKKRAVTPVYDKEAAVKYMSWDNDQWISFDDEETFRDKIDWADKIGFSGSLIWASDLDDYEFSAHKALTGKATLGTPLSKKQTQAPLVQEIDASFGSNCYVEGNQYRQSCDAGFVKVGADRDGISCKGIDDSLCGRVICCPKNAGMTDCQWRGSGKDCNGQCHPGEIKLAGSRGGGKPGESSPSSKCNRGDKAFCCKTSRFEDLEDSCRWTDHCGNDCRSDEEEVAYAYDRWGWATVFCNGYRYCCKKSKPIPFSKCHWVGKGDCADNTCSKSEVTLWTNDRGDKYDGCHWYRKKSLCCTPNADAIREMTCDIDLCQLDPLICEENPDYLEIDEGSFVKRTYYNPEDGEEYEYLEKRALPGEARPLSLRMGTQVLKWSSRIYPSDRKALFGGDGSSTIPLKGAFGMASTVCSSTNVAFTKLADLTKTGFHTEHFYENQMSKFLLRTAYSGKLPNGEFMKAATISSENLIAGWNKPYTTTLNKLVETVTDVKDWTAPNTPAERFMSVIGDYGYRRNLFYVDGPINGIKGLLHRGFNPLSPTNLKQLIQDGIAGGEKGANAIVQVSETLQKTFGAYSYMNDALLTSFVQRVNKDMLQEVDNMNTHIRELQGMLEIFREFEPVYQEFVAQKAREFVQYTTNYITLKLGAGSGLSTELAQLVWTAGQLGKRVDELRYQAP